MIVRFSREGIEIEGDGLQYTSGSLLMLLPQRGEARIARVGGTEEQVRAALLNATREGDLPVSLRIVSQGHDPWWDAQVAWPPRTTDRPVPVDDSEAFLLNPLSANGWSPPAIISLLRYTLAGSSSKGIRWLRWPFTRPQLSIEVVGDFTAVERAELLDVVDEAWGSARVVAPPGVARISKPPWWLLSWVGAIALLATSAYAVSHHWSLWKRLVASLVAVSPLLIAKRRATQLSRAAPRRSAARRANAAVDRPSS